MAFTTHLNYRPRKLKFTKCTKDFLFLIESNMNTADERQKETAAIKAYVSELRLKFHPSNLNTGDMNKKN